MTNIDTTQLSFEEKQNLTNDQRIEIYNQTAKAFDNANGFDERVKALKQLKDVPKPVLTLQ